LVIAAAAASAGVEGAVIRGEGAACGAGAHGRRRADPAEEDSREIKIGPR
jgi:hypothetical protein